MLKHRIGFYDYSESLDAYGGISDDSFSLSFTVWGKFKPINRVKNEEEIGDSIQNLPEAEVLVRYNESITEEMQLQHNSVNYEILGITPLNGDKVYQKIYVKKAVS